MGKKTKRNRSNNSNTNNNNYNNNSTSSRDEQRVAPALRNVHNEDTDIETKDNLKFEDPYIEEYDIDDEEDEEDGFVDDNNWEDDGADDDDEDIHMSSSSPSKNKNRKNRVGAVVDDDEINEKIQTWNPLLASSKNQLGNEPLEMDPTAYKLYHGITPEWPCLSFDFIRDEYGEARTRFPHKLISAIGTQADSSNKNQLTIMKVSDMSKIPNDEEIENEILGEEIQKDSDDDNESDDESDDDDEIELDPIMEHYSIPHKGGVNRVRTMPQKSNIVATWSDTGTVNIFNVEAILQRFDSSEGYLHQRNNNNNQNKKGSVQFQDIPTKPFFQYHQHKMEGFAMDWSRVVTGQLVTGSCNGSIHTWIQRPEGGYEVTPFFTATQTNKPTSHPSVEDLQWSPSERTVFASAECGGTVRIFDTRAPNRAMIQHHVHPAATTGASSDVNVLAWNPLVNNLLATGSDDGTLAVWDLRHFAPSGSKAATPQPLARFTPHTTPITSLEWHPTDESMLAVSDDVGAYVYDLSVEEDETKGTSTTGQMPPGIEDLPPQLLFVHSGSEQFKEIHWHPQISSCLMTTALSGFSIFIPSNL